MDERVSDGVVPNDHLTWIIEIAALRANVVLSAEDAISIATELLRFRLQRCETCVHWFQEDKRAPDDTRGWCMVNSDLYWWASDSCSRWQSREEPQP